MSRYNFFDVVNSVFDEWGNCMPSRMITSYSIGNVYDPEKYDLVLKKEYIDEKVKGVENAIQYHEEQIKRLREEKEKLLDQKEKKKK